ncbi:hypothetical protein CJJ09_004805 [Candidozyma auris]|nr:hypothetical protein CJJ09_004805 [[Candida] auris]
MSLSFSIAYNNVSKKVTCSRTNTVNQLASLAIAKFNLPSSVHGCLLYNGKKLDGLLPLRLTNLVNNAKLSLEVSTLSRPVTLKVVGSVLGESKQKIIKTKTDSSLEELLDTFAKETGTKYEGLYVQINSERKIQAKQTELRRQLEEHKRQARLLEKRLKEEAGQTEQESQAETKQIESATGEQVDDENSSPQSESDSFVNVVEKDAGVEDESQEMDTSEPPISPPSPTATPDPSLSGVSIATYEPESFQVKQIDQDTVFVPQGRSQHYENPDSDYNLTVAQAEKYYSIIKSMQTNKRQAPKDVIPPSSYKIRIRFPDRALLDIRIDESSMKLGQLLKKVDGYVHERHINSYRLRNGVPPFEEIAVGFQENNKELKHHKFFQNERIMLIWESTEKSAKGPFLKSTVNTRSIEEMPTVQLETNRGQLADEEAEKRRHSGSEASASNKSEKKKHGLPKWFKPGK